MPDPTPPPQGKSWKLCSLKDTPENVIESVQAAAFVPDACKAMLTAAIAAVHPVTKLIRLDAHCQIAAPPERPRLLLTVDIAEL